MPTEIDNPWLIVGGVALWFTVYFVYKVIKRSKK